MATKPDLSTAHIEDVLDGLMPPDIIVRAGQPCVEAYARFFAARLNSHTNEAYSRALRRFLRYLATQKIDLLDLRASQIAAYSKQLTDQRRTDAIADNSLRQHLSAIRMFLDACVLTGALSSNPATVVRPPRRNQTRGTTKVIVPVQVRQILDAIPLKTQADYRDRALIAFMVYSFYRISAALSLKVGDYDLRGEERWVAAREKGSKHHEMPIHPQLEIYLDEHLREAGTAQNPEAWLFPSAHGRSGKLNHKPYSRKSAWEMVRRRAVAAGVMTKIGNHSLRATGITAYMSMGGTLEKAQKLAGHSHISTTMLYDRSEDSEKSEEISRLEF